MQNRVSLNNGPSKHRTGKAVPTEPGQLWVWPQAGFPGRMSGFADGATLAINRKDRRRRANAIDVMTKTLFVRAMVVGAVILMAAPIGQSELRGAAPAKKK